jgi:hypothetical protein
MIKAAGVFSLFVLLLMGGTVLSGSYQLRAFDATLSRILRAVIAGQRDGRLAPPATPVPTREAAA